ncbi:methyltransferase domain-containing protein [Microbacterium sp. NPDC057407]|uniref:methyltransferase domain-containing protein n=1 Tax=Microbacterium sp. NPDC057407 TaxID=3346120 RepID=UPI0036722A19
MTALTDTTASTGTDPGPFAERMIDGVLGWMQTMSIHLGLELGWYKALAETPRTAAELAEATGSSARYAREWLEQQAAYDILVVDDADAPRDDRRFRLPADRAEVLLDGRSLAFAGPLATMAAASAAQLPAIVEAYRTGGGVSWEQLGELARTSQADINRPWFATLPDALADVPEIHALLSRPGARLADVGTGGGWSAIALASAYPQLEVVGIDIDGPSIDMARHHAAEAGVDDRVSFVHDDAANLAHYGTFDAAIALECVHDMPYPVAVLGAMRAAVRADGAVLVLDEAVGDRFTPNADDIERLMYGYSLFVCLPDSMSHPGSVATGTVIRPSILAGYAREAGFDGIETVLDEFGFWRLYRLR